jgi:hypothetical protein
MKAPVGRHTLAEIWHKAHFAQRLQVGLQGDLQRQGHCEAAQQPWQSSRRSPRQPAASSR